jgi:hypothetical protein
MDGRLPLPKYSSPKKFVGDFNVLCGQPRGEGRRAYNSTILIDSGQPKGLLSTMTLLQLEHKIIDFR